jgi:hypothetical protein
MDAFLGDRPGVFTGIPSAELTLGTHGNIWIALAGRRRARFNEPMETPGAAVDLSFEKATYAKAEGGPPCANCKGPLGERYWEWLSRAVCEDCRGKLSALFEASQSRKAFMRAVLLGGATALGCGIAYAVFVALTDYQLVLLTIGIAFVIAKVVRRCSAGLGGRRYQILAVLLTYFASAMGYAPAVMTSLKEHSAAKQAAEAPSSGETKHPGGLVNAIIGIALLLAITLAAPVLAATEAPLGLLIVGFGLWEAWKLSKGVPISLNGPYRRSAVATGPPVA